MSTPLFPERFSAWLEAELRRQGEAQAETWRAQVLTHTHLKKPTPGPRTSAPSSPVFQGCALQMDLAGLHATDKVAVAVVEALLRLYTTVESTSTAEAGEDAALRGDWSISFRANDLTDASVPHLLLLVQTCQSLSRLDLRGNLFSASSKTDMLGVMSGAPCDVILDNGPVALSTHSSSDSDKSPADGTKHAKQDEKSPDTPNDAPLNANSASVPAPVTASAVRRITSTEHGTGEAHPHKAVSPEVSSSVATSRMSYASGSAEALRRRREGLFSKTRAASPGATTAQGTAATGPVPIATMNTATAAAAATTAAAAKVEASLSPETPHEEVDANDGISGGGDRGGVAAAEDEAGTDTADGRVRRGLLFASTPPRPTQASSSSPFHDDPNATSQASRAAGKAAQHEPIYGDHDDDDDDDRNDRLDLTSNLNPILDSVLDLAGAVAKDGRTLREPDLFGEAASIWEVLDAYEDAVEESLLGGPGGDSVDPDTSARLPASVVSSRLASGGAFNALTVLNLSKNNLTELHVLPATLLRLDVSSNQLTRLSGLGACKMLTVLNARRNQLVEIAGLERNLCLAHLFLGHNRLTMVEGLAHLLLLETLDLSFNQLRTQGALRALSLTSSLRHLLIRGNPVMVKLQAGFKPVLRNLCPSLLVIDDVKLSSSRFADNQQVFQSALRQPELMASAHSTARRAPSQRGAAAATGRSGQTVLATHHASAMSSPATRLHKNSRINTTNNGAGAGSGGTADGALSDQNAMNLLHLLTRGVTAPTGYGDGAKVAHTSKAMESRVKHQAADDKRRREREVTEGGQQLRTVMMKKLAEASKEYLETTLVERMTAAQKHTPHASHAASAAEESPVASSENPWQPAHSPLPAPPSAAQPSGPTLPARRASSSLRPSARTLHGPYGPVVDPLEESPLPDVMGYARLPPSVVAASAVAGAPPRRSSTRSTSRDTARRPTVPPSSSSPVGLDVVLGPYTPRASVSVTRHAATTTTAGAGATGGGDVSPRSTRSSRARAQSAQQRREAYSALVAAGSEEREAPRSEAGGHAEVDATLDAIYECDPDGGIIDGGRRGSRGAAWADVNKPDVQAAPQVRLGGAAGAGGGSGYAALHGRQGPALPASSPQRPDVMGVSDEAADMSLSPIPHSYSSRRRVAATHSEPVRHASPSLQPPPPLAGHVAVGARTRARPTSHLVGATRRLPREAATSTRMSQEPDVCVPLRTDPAQGRRVHGWSTQLSQDVGAVQMTLKTVVTLLEAQRQSGMPLAEHSHELPRTYLEERHRSVKIIEDSGMLEDITVPAEVALYYGFSKRELDGAAGSSSSGPRSLPRGAHSRRSGGRSQGDDRAAEKALMQDWSIEESERESVLRNVRVMGDAKTCLRYLLLLMGGGKERLLQEYVDQIKTII